MYAVMPQSDMSKLKPTSYHTDLSGPSKWLTVFFSSEQNARDFADRNTTSDCRWGVYRVTFEPVECE